MRRREFITIVGGAAAAWPVEAWAQLHDRIRSVGVIMNLSVDDPEGRLRAAAFRQRLQQLGWVEHRNLRIEFRWPGANVAHMRAYAEELVAMKIDVILVTSNPAMAVTRQVAGAIPIIFVTVADPVGSGFIESLARPGGNATGFTNFETSMGGKWLELLKEIAPSTTRVAIIFHPETASTVAILKAAETVAPKFRVKVVPLGVHNEAEIERAMVEFAGEPNGGLIAIPHPVTAANRRTIISLAIENKLPTVFAFRYFASDGGLMSYGIDQIDMYHQGASYVDRILRGERPSDLPVQAPTKFELVINAKTAKALGLAVPTTLLARADEVIE